MRNVYEWPKVKIDGVLIQRVAVVEVYYGVGADARIMIYGEGEDEPARWWLTDYLHYNRQDVAVKGHEGLWVGVIEMKANARREDDPAGVLHDVYIRHASVTND